jgi:hypothetical protein
MILFHIRPPCSVALCFQFLEGMYCLPLRLITLVWWLLHSNISEGTIFVCTGNGNSGYKSNPDSQIQVTVHNFICRFCFEKCILAAVHFFIYCYMLLVPFVFIPLQLKDHWLKHIMLQSLARGSFQCILLA